MPRRRTGSVVPCKLADGTVYYRARIRLKDNSREWMDLSAALASPSADAAARAQYVALAQASEDETRRLYNTKLARIAKKLGAPPPNGETVHAYVERRHKVRLARGLNVGKELSSYKKWIQPALGDLTVTEIGRAHLEKLVAHLDMSVDAKVITWKTASNVWGFVTKLCKDMCKSKRAGLRVRDDNPALLVEGPDRGDAKAKPYLYPSEFLTLVSCELVPVRWRRLFALTTYIYSRAGEVEALEWPDVHEDEGYILVHQAEREDGVLGSTKSGRTKKVPIEETLKPLLAALRKEAGGVGRVIDMPTRDKLPIKLRVYLKRAGVTRQDLFVSAKDRTRVRLRYHSLRDTGITWRAIRGDEPLKIMRAAGHQDLKMTQVYIAEAEVFSGDRNVFPVLPLSLFSPGKTRVYGSGQGGGQFPDKSGVGRAGIEPARKTEDPPTTAQERTGGPGAVGAIACVTSARSILFGPSLAQWADGPDADAARVLGTVSAGLGHLRAVDFELEKFWAAEVEGVRRTRRPYATPTLTQVPFEVGAELAAGGRS